MNADEVKWRTLLSGAEAVRRDGYDFMAWTGPQSVTAGQTANYQTKTQTAQSYALNARFLGFTYVIRGYVAHGDRPPNARPVSDVIDRMNLELARRK